MQITENGLESAPPAVLPIDGSVNIYDPGGEIGDVSSGGGFDLGSFGTPWGFTAQDIVAIVEIKGAYLFPELWTFPTITIPLGEPGIDGVTLANMSTGAPAPGTAGCPNGAIKSNKVDWGWIGVHEGTNVLNGYIPTQGGKVIENSGVTIATGYDLGQHSYAEMIKIGIPEDLAKKLSPYTGLTKDDAVKALSEEPLTITAEESVLINSASHSAALSRLVTQYDGMVGEAGAFWGLPAEAQTVIADTAFQFGFIGKNRPELWADMITANWEKLATDLYSETKYTSRRIDGGDLITQGIVNGKLRQGQFC